MRSRDRSSTEVVPDPVSLWHPTVAHLRASAAGVGLAIAAVLIRRPDLLVLAAPFIAISWWSIVARPRDEPVVSERIAHHTVREGEETRWHVRVAAPADRRAVDDVAVVFAAPPDATLRPETGALCAAMTSDAVSLDVALRSTRWGRRTVGPAQVVVSSPWAAFRWTSVGASALGMTTLPLPSAFDAAAPAVHPIGLVGLNRSARAGDGNEFASVRPFQSGDRLRRIHWPRSLRTGAIHVTSTWSDQDSHVVLVVDAFNDVGESDGIDGRASSLDISLRAAGAIAEHHVRRGDRVALHIVGAKGVVRVPAGTGTTHLRRMLGALAAIEPGTDHRDNPRLNLGLSAGALVVMLSPLISPVALQRAITLATRGLTVVVVDTLPPGITDDDEDDPLRGLAWRLRLLERSGEVRRVQSAGVPVIPWRGPGSLDQVLRDLHRRSATPRMARR